MSCLWLICCMPLCYTINRGIRLHILYTWRFDEYFEEYEMLALIFCLPISIALSFIFIVLFCFGFTTRYQDDYSTIEGLKQWKYKEGKNICVYFSLKVNYYIIYFIFYFRLCIINFLNISKPYESNKLLLLLEKYKSTP